MSNLAKDQATSNLAYAKARGSDLQDVFRNRANGQAAIEDDTSQQSRDYFSGLMQSPGYSDQEREGILGQSGSGNVPGLDDLAGVSPDEAQSNFLTGDEQAGAYLSPEEQAAMKGNPNDPLGYLHSDTIGQYMAQGDQAQNEAVSGLKSGLSGAIDPGKLALSKRYGSDVLGQVGNTASKLDSATGSPALDLSSDFNSKYELTPEQQQQMVNSAAQDVADVNRGQMEDIQRRNNAAGIGPLGMAAAQARYGRQSASDAANAAAKARIAASSEAANRVKSAEDLRLGAAQNKAGMQVGAGEFEGTQGVNALSDIEGKRLNSEQDISNRELDAAKTGGLADIQNQQNETAGNIGAVENVRNAEVSAHQTADQQAASRAAALGTNRQSTEQGLSTNRQTTQQGNNQQNYNRGAAANTALSSRYGTVGNTRIQQQNLGGQGTQNEEQIASGNVNAANSGQTGAFQATTGAMDNSTKTVGDVQAQPGTGSKILGAAMGGLSAAASFFEDGGIATQPTNAILGENGPEMVVPLSGAGGSQDSRPIGGTGGAPNDPFQAEAKKPAMWKTALQDIGRVAGGVQAGMSGQPAPSPMASRYGAPPAQPQVPEWKKKMAAIGGIASGVQAGMNGTQPPMQNRYSQQPSISMGKKVPAPPPLAPPSFSSVPPPPGASMITQPTHALLGDDGPEAVIPMKPKPAGMGRMRPSSLMASRYGAA